MSVFDFANQCRNEVLTTLCVGILQRWEHNVDENLYCCPNLYCGQHTLMSWCEAAVWFVLVRIVKQFFLCIADYAFSFIGGNIVAFVYRPSIIFSCRICFAICEKYMFMLQIRIHLLICCLLFVTGEKRFAKNMR